MSLEALKRIQEAEAQAEAGRVEAQREAREILKAAADACAQEEREAAAQNRELYQEILKGREAKVKGQLEELAAGQAKERDAFLNAARRRLDKAAAIIAERVLSDGNR